MSNRRASNAQVLITCAYPDNEAETVIVPKRIVQRLVAKLPSDESLTRHLLTVIEQHNASASPKQKREKSDETNKQHQPFMVTGTTKFLLIMALMGLFLAVVYVVLST